MERGRLSSYCLDTLSSNSSSGSVTSISSSVSYASIKSRTLSIVSKVSSTVRSLDFWKQFNRSSSGKKYSKNVFKDMFSKNHKSEPVKNVLSENESETSFIQDLGISTCPPGLYCVIDEFITEYDLRLLEEEERAEIVAKRSSVFHH